MDCFPEFAGGRGFFHREAIWISIPFALVTAGGALFTVYFIGRELPCNVFVSAILTMSFATLFADTWVLPVMDNYKSPRLFSLEVKKRVPATTPLYIYADTMNDFNFYIEREIIQGSYLLVRERDLEKVNTIAEAKIIVTRPIGGKNWYLISPDGRCACQANISVVTLKTICSQAEAVSTTVSEEIFGRAGSCGRLARRL